MRIALAQMDPVLGAFAANVALALDMAKAAAVEGADLVIYPAYALTGTPLEGLLSSSSFAEAAMSAVAYFAEKTPVPALISGVISDEEIGGFPEVFYCHDGKATPLSPSEFFDEIEEYDDDDSAGEAAEDETDEAFADDESDPDDAFSQELFPLIEVAGARCAVVFEDIVGIEDDLSDVDLIIRIAADPYYGFDTLSLDEELFDDACAVAATNGAWYAYCNLVGAQDSVIYPGGSFVISPWGDLITGGFTFTQCMLPAAIELGSGFIEGGLLAPETNAEEADWLSRVLAVKDYMRKNGFSDAVIGLSGGIDSAIVATIATDALGPEHVHGVLMPGPYSSEGSLTDAALLASNLGIETTTIPINEPFSVFKDVLAEACGGAVEGVTAENLQSRIRTVYLMALSNTHGWILLNTGNKSEAAAGYSTLYGDTAGAYAPIGDFYKTRLYELARWRNTVSPVIPEETLTKAPSAELSPGQRDEDSLPPYEELDAILAAHIDRDLSADEIIAEGHDQRTVHRVLRMVSAAEYKRRQEPLAPSTSYCNITIDRNWPITNRFVDEGFVPLAE